MSVPRVTTEIQVMFFDTDAAGVVHNVAWLRMIEVSRTHLAARIGMSLEQMTATQQFPVVVRTEIDYKRPARLGDNLVFEARLDSFSTARFWCALEVRKANDEAVLVQCRQMLALIEMPSGRPLRLPPTWNEEFRELRESRT